ncbi:MAG: hypothetical protein GXP45_02655 [bacterium]|nr:hypothetical protein [bacterium]
MKKQETLDAIINLKGENGDTIKEVLNKYKWPSSIDDKTPYETRDLAFLAYVMWHPEKDYSNITEDNYFDYAQDFIDNKETYLATEVEAFGINETKTTKITWDNKEKNGLSEIDDTSKTISSASISVEAGASYAHMQEKNAHSLFTDKIKELKAIANQLKDPSPVNQLIKEL